jgi:hypothetical protein
MVLFLGDKMDPSDDSDKTAIKKWLHLFFVRQFACLQKDRLKLLFHYFLYWNYSKEKIAIPNTITTLPE